MFFTILCGKTKGNLGVFYKKYEFRNLFNHKGSDLNQSEICWLPHSHQSYLREIQIPG